MFFKNEILIQRKIMNGGKVMSNEAIVLIGGVAVIIVGIIVVAFMLPGKKK